MNIKDLSINNLVTQSNKLIESKYNLNITEQRLILAMISMINPDDEDFRDYSIKISNLVKVLGLKDKNIYDSVKKITESIMKKVIQIKKPNGILQVNWISSADYDDNLGVVTLKFDPSLKPYLLNIKENYTSTKFGITAKFSSFYTSRIYLLVKQYQKIGERTILIDFLKEFFPQYQDYKDIKRRILIPAQKEISENSDIKFEIKERKIGKTVREVVFYNIRSQIYNQELPLYPPAIKEPLNETFAEKINRKYSVDIKVANKVVNEILEKDKNEDFDKIFQFIDSAILTKKVKNLPGFVVNCLQNAYYKTEKYDNSGDKLMTEQNDLFESPIKEELKFDNKNKFFKEFILKLQKEQKEIFEKWFSNLNFVKKESNEIVVCVETKFIRDWIKREYKDEILLPIAQIIDQSIKDIVIISKE